MDSLLDQETASGAVEENGRETMNITCSQLDDLLLEGDQPSLAIAAAHAQSCDTCLQTLASWEDLSATARQLHTTWNDDLLWPRIERAINDERSHRLGHLQLGPMRTRVWQIAAAVLLFATLAGVAWIAQRRMHAADFDEAILKASAVDEVEQAEKAHITAINHLQSIVSPTLDQPSTPLMVSYKEKLMMLDDAIAECQSAIDHNRKNAYLRTQLLTMYSEKQRTLQDVLREETTHASHQ
jgi:hypothetical protein